MRPRIVGALICSFCGKKASEVSQLIAGPEAFICNECIELCSDILAESRVTNLLAKQGRRIVSAEEAGRLAWMKTWTTAAPKIQGGKP